MKGRNLIDIIERFQTRHALQTEQEMKNIKASINGAPTPVVPDKNGMTRNDLFDTQEKHQHKGNPNHEN